MKIYGKRKEGFGVVRHFRLQVSLLYNSRKSPPGLFFIRKGGDKPVPLFGKEGVGEIFYALSLRLQDYGVKKQKA